MCLYVVFPVVAASGMRIKIIYIIIIIIIIRTLTYIAQIRRCSRCANMYSRPVGSLCLGGGVLHGVKNRLGVCPAGGCTLPLDAYKVQQEARQSQRKHRLAVITLFKVTDFYTNWKPLCNFLLVTNTTVSYILSHTVWQISCSIDQIIAFDRGCLSLTSLFTGTSKKVIVSHTLRKTRFFWLHFLWQIVSVCLESLLCNWPPKLPSLVE